VFSSRCSLLASVFLLFISPARAAITLDTSCSTVSGSACSLNGTSTNQLSWTFAVGSGATLLLVGATQDNETGTAVSSVTYGGQSLTNKVSQAESTHGDYASIWALANPPSGSNTLTVTYAASCKMVSAGGVALFGTAASPYDGTKAQTFEGSSYSDTITVSTSQANDWVFDAYDGGRSSQVGFSSWGTGQTGYFQYDVDNSWYSTSGGSYLQNQAAGNVSLTVNFNSSYNKPYGAHVALAIAPAAAPSCGGSSSIALLGAGCK
jgi:hypothetical protein